MLILVSLFTLGHSLALVLSVFNILILKVNIVELIIPITILITALYNFITSGKSSKKDSITFIAFITVFFGIIHGLGFVSYFNTIVSGKPTDKFIPITEFALGIECSQIITVIFALLLSFMVQNLFKFSKRDWTLTVSAFILGVVIPVIIQSDIWQK